MLGDARRSSKELMTDTRSPLPDDVTDRRSFLEFVDALARERMAAEEMENASPHVYVVDGALNWKNADIASFLFAALSYFEQSNGVGTSEPTWRMMAEFLYCGKIIE